MQCTQIVISIRNERITHTQKKILSVNTKTSETQPGNNSGSKIPTYLWFFGILTTKVKAGWQPLPRHLGNNLA